MCFLDRTRVVNVQKISPKVPKHYPHGKLVSTQQFQNSNKRKPLPDTPQPRRFTHNRTREKSAHQAHSFRLHFGGSAVLLEVLHLGGSTGLQRSCLWVEAQGFSPAKSHRVKRGFSPGPTINPLINSILKTASRLPAFPHN